MLFARDMTPAPPSDRASFLLMDECFTREDAGFLAALRRVDQPKLLAAFADRWKKDTRPWARAQIFAYLEEPLDSPGHQPLVKRLFKDAEARRDDELMGAFLVAFDTLVRRVRQKRWRWDRETRSAIDEEVLISPRNVLPTEILRTVVHPKTGERTVYSKRGNRVSNGRLFRYRTRHYLRRRAWRYFRWIGYARGADYPKAVAPALLRYHDDDLAKGENILDSWALLNLCFRGSDVIEFHPVHLRLRAGRSLGEMRAAPRFASAWETEIGLRVLLDVVRRGRAQLVRMWAMDLYRSVRVKVSIEVSPEEILGLLDHEDERVQQFGAELFGGLATLGTLPVATWLKLLQTRNATVLATLCAAFTQHVSSERLSLAQCLELACNSAVPLARLGQGLLVKRALAPADVTALGALFEAKCLAVAGELCTWALARLGTTERYDVGPVSRFFDSLVETTRDAAWAWLLTPGARGYDDPVLWSRLAETPFDDLKAKLIDHLALRVKTPALSADQLAPVWCAVLLGVHRGGRQKLKAVQQISDAIVRAPDSSASLLPVLAVAVRSIRGPEMRAGLAAVMAVVAARPELAPAVRARLPELKFDRVEAAA